MSAGLILARPPALSGIPSITTRAEELLKVLVPLIRIAGVSAPGAPLEASIKTPATFPASAVPKLGEEDFSRASPPIEATEPVSVAFLCVPYPVTTTSWSSSAPETIEILKESELADTS